MFFYGQTSSNAIALLSFLAALPAQQRAGTEEMAKARGISKALAGKLLTRLSQAGLVASQPGPGGGYVLARAAEGISLFEVVSLFEKVEPPSLCPMGHNWCGNGPKCPLHDEIAQRIDANRHFLHNTRLSIFANSLPQHETD